MTLRCYLLSNFQLYIFINFFKLTNFQIFKLNYGKFRYVGSVYSD